MHSQGREEEIILSYFENSRRGTFLDIGAFHPFTFSNTRALYEKGFKGVFVEPSLSLAANFQNAYGRDSEIEFFSLCVGATNGDVEFFDSEGDALSTTVEAHTEVWSSISFRRVAREMVTPQELVRRSRYNRFDFINVDTEGSVLEIAKLLDLTRLKTRLICAEWAGEKIDDFHGLFAAHGMEPIFINQENLIYARPPSSFRPFRKRAYAATRQLAASASHPELYQSLPLIDGSKRGG